jgi:hypothetical protein
VPPVPYSPVPGQPYWHPTYGWVPAQQSTNGLAIASLVLSILWLGGIGSILGVIFGHVSRGQIRRHPQKGKGLALAGLIVGYVGLAATIAGTIAVVVIWNNAGVRNSLLRNDIRNAAGNEESYLVEHQTYTNDPEALSNEGFVAWPREDVEVAYNGSRGFCIVGSRNNRDDWYLYDSEAGGLSSYKWQSATDAEHACTVPAPSSYVAIT